MKKVKNWDGKPVAAYQDADLAELDGVFAEAGRLWVKEWRDQGSEDRGPRTVVRVAVARALRCDTSARDAGTMDG